jgi:regulatory protein
LTEQVITALQLQKRNKERVNLFLDGEFAFALHLSLAANLQKGQTLSPAQINELQQADEAQSAYQSALYFLSYRPRSQTEVGQHLRGKEFAPSTIASVLQRLVTERYLDDSAFAQFWLESREQFRPRSVRALRYELRQKGVDKEVIDETLVTVDEEASAWAAVEGKLARWQTLEQAEFSQKVIGFLARRGFSYAITRQVCKRAWNTLDRSGVMELDHDADG